MTGWWVYLEREKNIVPNPEVLAWSSQTPAWTEILVDQGLYVKGSILNLLHLVKQNEDLGLPSQKKKCQILYDCKIIVYLFVCLPEQLKNPEFVISRLVHVLGL